MLVSKRSLCCAVPCCAVPCCAVLCRWQVVKRDDDDLAHKPRLTPQQADDSQQQLPELAQMLRNRVRSHCFRACFILQRRITDKMWTVIKHSLSGYSNKLTRMQQRGHEQRLGFRAERGALRR
jgi:hypothetical protein